MKKKTLPLELVAARPRMYYGPLSPSHLTFIRDSQRNIDHILKSIEISERTVRPLWEHYLLVQLPKAFPRGNLIN